MYLWISQTIPVSSSLSQLLTQSRSVPSPPVEYKPGVEFSWLQQRRHCNYRPLCELARERFRDNGKHHSLPLNLMAGNINFYCLWQTMNCAYRIGMYFVWYMTIVLIIIRTLVKEGQHYILPPCVYCLTRPSRSRSPTLSSKQQATQHMSHLRRRTGGWRGEGGVCLAGCQVQSNGAILFHTRWLWLR